MRFAQSLAPVVLICCASFCQAQKVTPLTRIKPLLSKQTIALVRYDLKKFDAAKLGKQFAMLIPNERIVQEMKKSFREFAESFRGVPEIFVVAYMPNGAEPPLIWAAPITKKANQKSMARSLRQMKISSQVKVIRGFVVAGEPKVLNSVAKAKPHADPLLAKAFATIPGNSDLQGVFLPSSNLRKFIAKRSPMLPAALGGGKTEDVLKSIKYVTAGMNLLKMSPMHIAVHAPKIGGAKKIKSLIDRAIANHVKNLDEFGKAQVGRLIKSAAIKRVQNRVEARPDGKIILFGLALPAVQKLRVTVERLRKSSE